MLAIQRPKLSEDAVYLLLAAAVGAKDKAAAVKAYNDLVEAAPSILPDRRDYSKMCTNCNTELRIQHWEVSHSKVLVHQSRVTVH